jgi:hypothetical protein
MDSESFVKELEGDSDRACALVAGAALSDVLRDLLATFFFPLTQIEHDHIFYDQNACLSDFASRTEVAYATGLISPDEKDALNTIRKIRNQFAHTIAQVEFSNPLLAAETVKLQSIVPAETDTKTGRALFIHISLCMYVRLLRRANRLGEPKTGGLGGSRLPIYMSEML